MTNWSGIEREQLAIRATDICMSQRCETVLSNEPSKKRAKGNTQKTKEKSKESCSSSSRK